MVRTVTPLPKRPGTDVAATLTRLSTVQTPTFTSGVGSLVVTTMSAVVPVGTTADAMALGPDRCPVLAWSVAGTPPMVTLEIVRFPALHDVAATMTVRVTEGSPMGAAE